MKRTPEQEAARKERSHREATFPKCPCGNVAGLGQTYCSACRAVAEVTEERADRFKAIRDNLRCGLYPAALDAIVDILEDLEPFRCKGCDRPEEDCSADPCPDVIEDRGEL